MSAGLLVPGVGRAGGQDVNEECVAKHSEISNLCFPALCAALGSINPGEFGSFPFPGFIDSAELSPQHLILHMDVGLTLCCVNCGAHIRRGMETSPEGDIDAG